MVEGEEEEVVVEGLGMTHFHPSKACRRFQVDPGSVQKARSLWMMRQHPLAFVDLPYSS